MKESDNLDGTNENIDFEALAKKAAETGRELNEEETEKIKASVGGELAFEKLLTWAKENLGSVEIESFNDVIDKGDLTYIFESLNSLKEKYEKSTNQKLEEKEPDELLIKYQSHVDNILKLSSKDNSVKRKLKLIREIDSKNNITKSKNKDGQPQEKDVNVKSKEFIYSLALHIASNAVEIVCEEGKEEAVNQLTKEINSQDLEDYAPGIIDLSIEATIKLWNKENLIPIEEAIYMGRKARRKNLIHEYRQNKQTNWLNEFLANSGGSFQKIKNNTGAISLIADLRNYVCNQAKNLNVQSDQDFPEGLYTGCVSIVLETFENLEGKGIDDAINKIAVKIANNGTYIVPALILFLLKEYLAETKEFDETYINAFTAEVFRVTDSIEREEEELYLQSINNLYPEIKISVLKKIKFSLVFIFNSFKSLKSKSTKLENSRKYILQTDTHQLYYGLDNGKIEEIISFTGGEDSHNKIINWSNKNLSRRSIYAIKEIIREVVKYPSTDSDNTLLTIFEFIKEQSSIVKKKFPYMQIFSICWELWILRTIFELPFKYIPFQFILFYLLMKPLVCLSWTDEDLFYKLDFDLNESYKIFKNSGLENIIRLISIIAVLIIYFVSTSLPFPFYVSSTIFFLGIYTLFDPKAIWRVQYIIKNRGVIEFYREAYKARKSINLPF